MAIVINGSGTVTGLAVGGLPDGTVDAGTLATDSVVTGKIADGTIANADIADLAASKLTGALPAISGASLTNLPSSNTGKILQSIFVQNATDIAFPQNTTTATTIVSAAITPSATNSKIVIYWSYRGELNGGSYPAVNLALSRTISGSAIGLQYEYYIGYMGSTTTHRVLHTPGFYQDTPNTTSEITYYLYGGNTTGSGFSGTYGGHANGNNNKSEILIMEIGA